jgi:hypothetical protein
MTGELTTEQEGELTHNLVREWVSERLKPRNRPHATVQSQIRGQGVPFPTEAGEHQDPIKDVVVPHLVDVFVALPGDMTEEQVKEVIEYLEAEINADPTLGGRVGSARFAADQAKFERQDNHDLGSDAWRLTAPFTAQEPKQPVDESLTEDA